MNQRIKFIIALLFAMIVNTSGAQKINLTTLLTAMQSKTAEDFLSHMKKVDVCYHSTFSDSSYAYYRHISCGEDTLTAGKITVMFAIGKDGVFNSSVSTRNARVAENIQKELLIHHFLKTDTPAGEENNELIEWYHSEQYPKLNLMWEIFYDNNNNKVWHIGLVWTT